MEDVLEREAAGAEATQATEEEEEREVQLRATNAARRYLESNGFEVMETDWSCDAGTVDIIADEDGTICFISLTVKYLGLAEEVVTADLKRRCEQIALQYLLDADGLEDGRGVRFDRIDIAYGFNNRALLRHHRGCFSGCSDD